MTLLTIAEVLAGEVLITPGGVVDRSTVAADEIDLWQEPQDVVPAATAAERADEVLAGV